MKYDIASGGGLILITHSFAENILPDSTVAPGLLANQKEVRIRSLPLWHYRWAQCPYRKDNTRSANNARHQQLQKHMLGDKLNDKISHRPTPDALLKGGVLHEDPRSAEEKYEEAMEEEYAKREGGA